MQRKDEIRKLYQMTTEELVAAARGRLRVVDDWPGHFDRSSSVRPILSLY